MGFNYSASWVTEAVISVDLLQEATNDLVTRNLARVHSDSAMRVRSYPVCASQL